MKDHQKVKKKKKEKQHTPGGQAVIGGVMMMLKDYYAVSVRKKDGKIVSKVDKIGKRGKRSKMPFIRGIFNIVDMMMLGMKSLIWASNQVDETEEEFTNGEIFLSIFFALGFSVLLFIILPLFLSGFVVSNKGFFFHLVDGLLRVLIVVGYILVISLSSEVRDVFRFHGAEHKVVNCYENKKRLTVKNCKKFTTIHNRCGTAFIMVVLVLSIITFSIVRSDNILIQFAIRLLFIPLIASVSYEIIKFADTHDKNIFMKILLYPGLLIQKLTTKEPSESQIEVAIHSLKKVFKANNIQLSK